jgi:phage/plasmid-associated DNA primase
MTATKFMENADQVRRFIFEAEEAGKINLTVDGQCVRTDLYKVYSEWAKASGVGALGNRRFYERLASVPGVSRTDKMSSGKRYVSGLNLNTTSWNATSDRNGYT